jgi:hypothetical protein
MINRKWSDWNLFDGLRFIWLKIGWDLRVNKNQKTLYQNCFVWGIFLAQSCTILIITLPGFLLGTFLINQPDWKRSQLRTFQIK